VRAMAGWVPSRGGILAPEVSGFELKNVLWGHKFSASKGINEEMGTHGCQRGKPEYVTLAGSP